MKKIKQIFIIIAVSILSNSFGQTDELKKFLEAYKTKEFDESKKIIQDYSFNLESDYIMSEYSSIDGIIFDTDLSGVKGYKAIITCKLENETQQFIDKRMMVVMYFDKVRKRWAVFEIREVIDATNEYNIAKNNVEANNFYTKKEYVYRNLAYWCMMASKLQDANKYIELGITEAKSSNNLSFTTNIDSVLKVIK